MASRSVDRSDNPAVHLSRRDEKTAQNPSATGTPRETFGRWWATLVNFYTAHPQAFIFLETQDHSGLLNDESRALGAKLDRQVLSDFRAWQKLANFVCKTASP